MIQSAPKKIPENGHLLISNKQTGSSFVRAPRKDVSKIPVRFIQPYPTAQENVYKFHPFSWPFLPDSSTSSQVIPCRALDACFPSKGLALKDWEIHVCWEVLLSIQRIICNHQQLRSRIYDVYNIHISYIYIS